MQVQRFYDIDTANGVPLARKIGMHQRVLERAELLPSDTGWSVDDALSTPPDATSFAAVLSEMRVLHDLCPDDPDRLAPERLSIVIAFELTRSELDWANRCGAAWAMTYHCMYIRGWKLADDIEALEAIMFPGRDMFARYTTAGEIASLLRECYIAPPKFVGGRSFFA